MSKEKLRLQCDSATVALSPHGEEEERSRSSAQNGRLRGNLVKLWVAMVVTLCFTAAMLYMAHVTHSLTLRIEAYHSLYNLFSLIGCIVTMKICQQDKSIKNTFGWARIELVLTLCTLLFLCALCFGVAIDSIQTAAHAGHQVDAMHHPMHIIVLAGIGLCVNSFIFFLIGGYTLHQGSLLERRNSSIWAVNENETHDCSQPDSHKKFQGIRGTLRDIIGLFLVIVCAAFVLWDEGQTLALYIDPAFAISTAAVLFILSYPYGKECSQILLQTIPAHIDVQDFSGRLLRKFPGIVNIHHFHIWSLTPGQVIATVHVVFENPSVYKLISNDLSKFFMEEEITKVTLQPEFLSLLERPPTILEEESCECLLQCENDECQTKICCQGAAYAAPHLHSQDISSVKTKQDGRWISPEFRVTIDANMSTSAFRTSNISLPCQKTTNNSGLTGKLSISASGLCKSPEKSSFVSLPGKSKLSVSTGRIGEFFAAVQKL